jgi:hypothetical protein
MCFSLPLPAHSYDECEKGAAIHNVSDSTNSSGVVLSDQFVDNFQQELRCSLFYCIRFLIASRLLGTRTASSTISVRGVRD